MEKNRVFIEKPDDFKAEYEAAGCFVEYNREILLFHRKKDHLWGIPETKVLEGELPLESVVRTLKEKTSKGEYEGFGISGQDINHGRDVYVKNPEHDFKYSIFHISLSPAQREHISRRLDENKTEYIWMNINSAKNVLDLVRGLDEYIRLHILK
ncbi:NUDIX domain-containing protein [Candidatus Woesearchaeota archaeon]|nr:NUDIX domain-containing protein [Candidatus Woesearchaeota archaeon]